MAGAGGFEPPHGGIKIPCLTTWRRPNSAERSRRDRISPSRAARCRKVADRLPSGSPEPHRFTMAAQVLEHFPAKWKPAFWQENAVRKGKFAPFPLTGPAFAPCRGSKNGGCSEPVLSIPAGNPGRVAYLRSPRTAVEGQAFSWDDKGR